VGDRASRQFFPSGSFQTIVDAMRASFNQGNVDDGVSTGVDLVLNQYRSHEGSLNRARSNRSTVPAGATTRSDYSSGGFHMSWLWWLIALAVIFFVIRGIFRAIAGPRMYPPGYGGGPMGGAMGGPMGGPGYGGGYGGDALSLRKTQLTRAQIIETVPRFNSTELLFPTRWDNDRPLSGWSKYKSKMTDGVAGWTLHDLRRTFATRLAQMKVAPHVVERRDNLGLCAGLLELTPDRLCATILYAPISILANSLKEALGPLPLPGGRPAAHALPRQRPRAPPPPPLGRSPVRSRHACPGLPRQGTRGAAASVTGRRRTRPLPRDG